MPLRPFAPSDNDAARPDAVAALAALLKGDAKASPDVDAFLDSYLAHRSQRESDALRPLDERVLTLLARHKLSAPRLVGCARVFRERSPALCEAAIREAPCIDELAAFAPILSQGGCLPAREAAGVRTPFLAGGWVRVHLFCFPIWRTSSAVRRFDPVRQP